MTSSPASAPRPTLGVFKFASCDGCQLTLLDCEDDLLPLAERVRITHFPRSEQRRDSRTVTTWRSSRAR